MAIVGSVQVISGADAAHYYKPNALGWAFDMIASIEITYSNSLMQNMFIRGETLKDYCLLTCCSDKERKDMLRAAGSMYRVAAALGVNTFKFCVPLAFLNHSPGSLRNSWPVDGSVLAGPIQISVNWRPFAYGFVVTNAGALVVAAPLGFTELSLTAKTTQLQDASFSVKKAMMLDPQLVYSLPARYITSVAYSTNFPAFVNRRHEKTINLSSAPSGMLE